MASVCSEVRKYIPGGGTFLTRRKIDKETGCSVYYEGKGVPSKGIRGIGPMFEVIYKGVLECEEDES